jgi:hypothetical protein
MTEDLTNLELVLNIDSVTVVSEGIKYLNKTELAFDSELSADMLNSIYTFKENELQLNQFKLGFDGFVEMPEEDIYTDVTFLSEENQFKDVLSLVPAVYMKDFEDVETAGEFSFDGYVKGTYNDTLMPAYGINLTVSDGYFKYPDLPKSVKNINIDVKVDAKEGTGDDMTVDLKKASLTMAGNPVSMDAFINMTAYDVGMKGHVKGKVDLNSVKDVVPLDDTELSGNVSADIKFDGELSDIENENYEAFDASGNLTVEKVELTMPEYPEINIQKTSMDFSPQFVELKRFDATVGKSDLHLDGRIDNLISYVFKEELLTGTFNFKSDLLDLNELLSLGSEDTEGETDSDESESEQTGEDSDSEPVEIPSNLDFTLNSKLKKIKYEKLDIKNAVGKIIIRDSKLDMQQLKMDLLGGSMILTGSYDTKIKDKPMADLSMQISNFDIPEVYQAFATVKQLVPIAENCVGDISAGISLTSVLNNDMMPIFNTLNSQGNLNSNRISVKDNKLMGSLADRTKQDKFRSPKIKDFDISYLINNGDLTIKPATFKLAGTEVSFGGVQKLDRSLDLDLGMMLPQKIAGNILSKLPLGNSADKIDVKAKIGGTATDPKITGFSSSATGDLKEGVEEKIEDVKEEVGEKVNELLENAQKEADKIIKEAELQADKIRQNADAAGKKLISEAEAQGDKLIREAKNPIAKKAAEITKKEMVDKAKKQANNLNLKADKEANDLVNAAKVKADKIVNDAKTKTGN